jgi:hypothetical protein
MMHFPSLLDINLWYSGPEGCLGMLHAFGGFRIPTRATSLAICLVESLGQILSTLYSYLICSVGSIIYHELGGDLLDGLDTAVELLGLPP